MKKIIALVSLGILALIAIIMAAMSTVTIDGGEAGVMFKKFGGGIDKEEVFGEGFMFIAPWNDMRIYNIRVQEDFQEMEVLSKNGLNIKVELSYRYRPIKKTLGFLEQEVGQDYNETIIKPEIRSATREIIGKYLPDELYATKRETIQSEIFDKVKESVESKFVFLDVLLIRDIGLPQKLVSAIESKLAEEQESLQYEFKLDKERKEAERRMIEANSMAEANRVLNASLTDKILLREGIEATRELAKSPNSKVVVVGSGDSGLPLILGGN